MSPPNQVVVAAQTARVIAGARRKGRSGTRRPIFGHLSLVQQQSLASVKADSSNGKISKGKASSRSVGDTSPKSVVDNFDLVASAESSTSPNLMPSTKHDTLVECEQSYKTATLPPLRLPLYTWQLHERLAKEASRRRLALLFYNIQIIVGTAATIVMAVVYAHYYADETENGFPSLDNPTAVAVFVATILLPLYVMYLVPRRSKYAKRYPLEAAQTAIAKWQAEIYMFQTQVGPYTTSSSFVTQTDSQELKRRQAAKDRLQEGGQSIWNSILPMVIDREFPTTDENVQTFNAKHVNDSNTCSQSSANQRRNDAAPVVIGNPSYQAPAQWEEELPCCVIPTPLTNEDSNNVHLLPLARDLEAATETTPMLVPRCQTSSIDGNESNNEEETLTDPYAIWTIEQYVQERFKPALDAKSQRLTWLQFWHCTLQRLIAVLTVSASLTALVAQQWMIPIVLALAAAGTSTLEASSLARQLDTQFEAVEQLQTLLGEWEKSTKNNDDTENVPSREHLVQQVEDVLVAAAS